MACGLAPAAITLIPSLRIASHSTVAVVVPSPTSSEVFDATSFIILAPMFSNGSPSSTSLDTLTPSLVMDGEPKLFSMTTFRPVGPSVTFTALASCLTPFCSFLRASSSNINCLASIETSAYVTQIWQECRFP